MTAFIANWSNRRRVPPPDRAGEYVAARDESEGQRRRGGVVASWALPEVLLQPLRRPGPGQQPEVEPELLASNDVALREDPDAMVAQDVQDPGRAVRRLGMVGELDLVALVAGVNVTWRNKVTSAGENGGAVSAPISTCLKHDGEQGAFQTIFHVKNCNAKFVKK